MAVDRSHAPGGGQTGRGRVRPELPVSTGCLSLHFAGLQTSFKGEPALTGHNDGINRDANVSIETSKHAAEAFKAAEREASVQRKTGRIPRPLSGHSALCRRHRERHPARSPAVPSLLPGGARFAHHRRRSKCVPRLRIGVGPLILGHPPEEVVEEQSRQLRRGFGFGAQHDLEFDVAERLTELIPCADPVAFPIVELNCPDGPARCAGSYRPAAVPEL